MSLFADPKNTFVSPAADLLRSRAIDLRGMHLVVSNNRVPLIDEAISRSFGMVYMTWPVGTEPDLTTLRDKIRARMPFIVVDKVDLVSKKPAG